MSLGLEVEVFGGSLIEPTCEQACELATRLGLTVTFEFNGVRCMANPGGDPRVLSDNWRATFDRGGKYPMASTNPRQPTTSSEPLLEQK